MTRVGEVALLGGHRHDQVFPHQKAEQVAILVVEPVVAGELQHGAFADEGMIAAAALADVVEQRSHDQHPRPLEVAHQLAAERIFVRVLCHHEAAQVANDHQRVLIHRVDVEQVVLHAADDAPERNEVAAEHRPLVHQAQRVGDAFGGLQDGEEAGPIDRVAPVAGVDLEAGMPERTQGADGHAVERTLQLQGAEGPQDQPGIALEFVRVAQVELVVDLVEVVVDGPGRAGVGMQDADFQRLHQQRAELRDGLGGQVIGAHQLFGACTRPVTPEIHRTGHRWLEVEDQPVFTAACEDVQPGADALEQALVALQLAGFQWLDDTRLHQ